MNKSKTKQIISDNHNKLDNAIDAVLVSDFMPAERCDQLPNGNCAVSRHNRFISHIQRQSHFNILKWHRPEIAFELRNAISKVINQNKAFVANWN
jgi:two-component system CheB/CheR fusion protein